MDGVIEDLNAVADLLASVIAFLLPYKSSIVKGNIIAEKLDQLMYSTEDYNLIKLNERFEKIRTEIKEPEDYVAQCIPVLISLDEMIGERLIKLVNGKSIFLGESAFLSIGNGINSENNKTETNIMILPRWITKWEGSGRDTEIISDSFNRFLKHSRYIELEGGLIALKYKANCTFLSQGDAAHYSFIDKKDKLLRIGMSPMSMDFKLKDALPKSEMNFRQKSWDSKEKKKIQKIIFDVIKKAEKEKVNILVFPEMLGYPSLKDEICEYVLDENIEYIRLIVLPSVCECVDGKYTNTSYMIHALHGEEIVSQQKLAAFYKDEKIEDIASDGVFELVYDEVHGCIGILICKTALEDGVRRVALKNLGVKLLICPSWSEGTHAFINFMKATAEWNCNVIWVNSCSALRQNGELSEENPVCAMTRYYKKPKCDKEPEIFFPIKDCNMECKKGEPCLFVSEIEVKD